MTFYALQKIRASALNLLAPQLVIKGTDEDWNSTSGGGGTTLQSDTELFITVAAGVSYALSVDIGAIEAGGVGVTDIKIAWTQPSGCTLNLFSVAPHIDWSSSAAALETEWASWTSETGTTTSSKSFGTTSSAVFGYHWNGSIVVGSTGGTFRMQWAQRVANAANLTVKAGSRIAAWPIPS